jgi:hypothetical protein
MDREFNPNKRLAVLLSTGGLNPIHNGHLDLFNRAKRCLENEHNFAVVGGFISPSHDLYVGPKCKAHKTFHFSAHDRLKLTRLACQDSDWLECASWESEQEGYWPDFPEVLQALQDFLSSSDETKMRSFTVLYVCGLDHADKCCLHGGFHRPNQGVVIVPRSDMPPASSKPDLLVFGVTETNAEVEHLSSTLVRRALHEGTPIDPSWMSRPVAEELYRIYTQQTAPSRVPSSPLPQVVFISLPALVEEQASIPIRVLENSLCLFDSKRMWVWPEDAAAKDEAAQQPGAYLSMPAWLREQLVLKEKRGEVHFLLPNQLGSPVGDYAGASAWLAKRTDPRTGEPHGPLRLEREWWERSFQGGQFVQREGWESVVFVFEQGRHSHLEVRQRAACTQPSARAPVARSDPLRPSLCPRAPRAYMAPLRNWVRSPRRAGPVGRLRGERTRAYAHLRRAVPTSAECARAPARLSTAVTDQMRGAANGDPQWPKRDVRCAGRQRRRPTATSGLPHPLRQPVGSDRGNVPPLASHRPLASAATASSRQGLSPMPTRTAD